MLPSDTARRAPALPWSPAAERAAILGFWALLAALEVLRRVVAPPRPFGGDTQPLVVALGGAAIYLVWALLTPLVFRLTHRFPLERGWLPRRVLLHLGLGLLAAVAVASIDFAITRAIYLSEAAARPGSRLLRFGPEAVVLRLWFLDEFVIYFGVLAAGFARNTLMRLHERERETAGLKAEAAQLQAQLADARLATLRMQLNPHFLFNTLHTVSALADEDPEGVQRIVARLSALLRRTLEGSARQEVPLAEELSFLRDYLDIQRVRFQGRLEVSEAIDPDTLDALVPNLILQPLVENAVKHGSDGMNGGVTHIGLSARHEPATGRLILTVRDNGPGMPRGAAAQTASAGGVGLANTRARLDALYGADGVLTLDESPGGGLLAAIMLPYHTAGDLLPVAHA